MSNTFTALVTKTLLTIALAIIAFNLFATNPFSWVVILGLAGAALNYLIGDLFILTSFGNTIAAVSDGLLAALTAFMLSWLVPTFNISLASLAVFAILIAFGEYFFHFYLKRTEKTIP